MLVPQIAPIPAAVDGLSSRFVLPVKPWSVNVLQLHLGASPSGNLQPAGGGGFSDGVASS